MDGYEIIWGMKKYYQYTGVVEVTIHEPALTILSALAHHRQASALGIAACTIHLHRSPTPTYWFSMSHQALNVSTMCKRQKNITPLCVAMKARLANR